MSELYHYGVLGMKWGRRKARTNVEKSNRAKESAKEWDEIANYKESKGRKRAAAKARENAARDREEARRYSSKANKLEKKHMQRAGGRKAYNYSAKESTGKSVAKSLLFGTYGTLRYNEARAKGTVRGRAIVNGLLSSAFNKATLGIGGAIESRMREDKNKTRVKNVANKSYKYMFKD